MKRMLASCGLIVLHERHTICLPNFFKSNDHALTNHDYAMGDRFWQIVHVLIMVNWDDQRLAFIALDFF